MKYAYLGALLFTVVGLVLFFVGWLSCATTNRKGFYFAAGVFSFLAVIGYTALAALIAPGMLLYIALWFFVGLVAFATATWKEDAK